MIDQKTGFRNEAIAGRDIYVDLDSLFDTRLAILDKIDTKYATLVYGAGFAERVEDAFPNISKEQFKKLFDERDNDILSRSLLTGVVSMVEEHLKETVKTLHKTPGSKEVNVYINCWPYEFDIEGVEMILKPIHEMAQNRANIHAMNKDPRTIPSSFFSNKFAFLVMYDYTRWLFSVLDDPRTISNPMAKTTLIAPKLFLADTFDDKDMQEMLGAGNLDPFREIELVCAPYIGLEFLELPIFSAMLPASFIQKRKEELGI